jgi:hypothetical protein
MYTNFYSKMFFLRASQFFLKEKSKTVCTRRGRELLIGASHVSIEDFLVDLHWFLI